MGKIVVIEGTDFSGKTTHFDELKRKLLENGIVFGSDSFPNYDSESSLLVRAYLKGDFGSNPNNIDPKIASLFYSLDRCASYNYREWGKVYKEGGNILFARYITSNILHQASKYKTWIEKKQYIDWLYNVEIGLLGLPKETKVLLLDMPPDVGQKLKEKRLKEQNGLTSSGEVIDIHENDKEYLKNSYNTAKEVAEYLNWDVISCVDKNGELRTIEDINNEMFIKVLNIFSL